MTIKKRFIGKKPNTTIALTRTGQEAIRSHWDRLERLRKASTTAPR